MRPNAVGAWNSRLVGFGLLFAFITASGAIGASIRALEAINQTSEDASFVRSNLTRLWLTVTLMALMLVVGVALLIAGPLFGSIADAAGMGDSGRELVQMTLAFVDAIKAEVILSFLGLGVKDGMSWGLMISESTLEFLAGHFTTAFGPLTT